MRGRSSDAQFTLGPVFPAAVAQQTVSHPELEFVNINAQNLKELIERTKKDFRFKYVGGGYFRDKNVPQGKTAELKHGQEIINEFCEELIKHLTD
jgi:hypothetical protein